MILSCRACDKAGSMGRMRNARAAPMIASTRIVSSLWLTGTVIRFACRRKAPAFRAGTRGRVGCVEEGAEMDNPVEPQLVNRAGDRRPEAAGSGWKISASFLVLLTAFLGSVMAMVMQPKLERAALFPR